MGKILVIDDEVVIGNLLKDVLQSKGHDVLYLTSAREGIAMVEGGRENLDLLIIDLKMPEMGGVDLLRTLKGIDPYIVVVVITGHPTFESIQSVLRLGGYDYITKPFNIEDISFVVERAISYHNLILLNAKLKKDLESQNIILDNKVQERTKELLLLTEIAQEISSHLSLEDVLDTIVVKVTTVLTSEICSILLYDKNTEYLKIKASCGLEYENIEDTLIRRGSDISGWVFDKEEPVLVENIESDERFKKRNKEKYYTSSFLSIPLQIRDEVIGVINVSNKKSKQIYTEDDFRFVKGLALEAAIAIENASIYQALEGTALNTIYALTKAVDLKDNYSQGHADCVDAYGTAIAQKIGLSKKQIEEIHQACLLHDIGKVAIHDYILTKTGELTAEEWNEIKMHPMKGSNILRPLKFLGEIINLVEQHHEKYDGTGYPKGLKGNEIALGARIMAVADSYSAMITDRPYRKALSQEESIAEIQKNRGAQFDPDVVDAFLRLFKHK